MAPTTPQHAQVYEEGHARGSTFYAVTITLAGICTVLLGLRLYARHIAKAGLKIDDYCSMAALVLTLGNVTACCLEVMYGLGQTIGSVPKENLPKMFQSVFAAELFYQVANALIKLSLVLYFLRLFPTPAFTKVLYATMAYLLVWMVAFFFAFIFQCTPVSFFWTMELPGRCGDLKALYAANGITSLFSDVVLLLLPLPIIWSLNVRLVQKIMLSGIFALGGFAIAISIVRLALMFPLNLASTNPTWDWYLINLWSPIEICVCYICSCLPTLGPFIHCLHRRSTGSSGYTRSQGTRKLTIVGNKAYDNMGNFDNLGNDQDSTVGLAELSREEGINVESREVRYEVNHYV